MSEELTLDMAIERIGELVRDVDKLNLNWKNELGRRVEAEAKIEAAHAAGAAEERARVVALLEKKIGLLTVEANDAGDILAAATGYAIGTLQGLLRKVKAP